MKNKRRELLAWVGVIITLTIFAMSGKWLPVTVDWLRHDKPPEVEQVVSSIEEVQPPTAEQLEQEKLLEQVKKTGGSSVLLRTEKIGDNVKPLIVRHYARYTETGSVEYWTELID
ncbi:hypothetical protein NHG33_06650 [Aerococcaceae bacterium NML130460]|nr:hypothetical protein [Aerococcaceae bacterium NML130460]